MFMFVDYIHSERKVVPLDLLSKQPPLPVIDAVLYKMKADYLRISYECLSGDNGLLNVD